MSECLAHSSAVAVRSTISKMFSKRTRDETQFFFEQVSGYCHSPGPMLVAPLRLAQAVDSCLCNYVSHWMCAGAGGRMGTVPDAAGWIGSTKLPFGHGHSNHSPPPPSPFSLRRRLQLADRDGGPIHLETPRRTQTCHGCRSAPSGSGGGGTPSTAGPPAAPPCTPRGLLHRMRGHRQPPCTPR